MTDITAFGALPNTGTLCTKRNQIPMRSLGWLSPVQYLKRLTVQNV